MRHILELGSGANPWEGGSSDRVIHLDCVEGPCVEVYANLEHGIPLPSCIFDEVIALDVIEHIPNVVGLMDEIHRVLVDNGKLSIRVPQAGTYNHITDPTHVRGFGIDSFDFFDDKTELGRGNGRLYTSRRWSIIDKGPQNLNLIFNMLALKPYTRRRSWL